MKRTILCLLMAVLIAAGCGCGDKPVTSDNNNAAAISITELAEMGIPEIFLADLEDEDLGVMHQELGSRELGEIQFKETVEGDLRLRMLIVPVCDGLKWHEGDCIRVYGTYQWDNQGITLPREDEMRLSWDEELFLLGDSTILTRSYKAKADGTGVECHDDVSVFAHIGQGDAGWYHKMKSGAGSHLQKGVFGLVLMPVHTYNRVVPTEQAKKTETDINLEYTVHGLFGSSKDTYTLSEKTELYITE